MNSNSNGMRLINMSEVEAEEIKWLWYPYIPYGKITIIQGDPGEGKSTFILNVASKLSLGQGIEDSMKVDEPANVIYQTAEDGLADTVKPRLLSAGADCERILVIDESDKSLSMNDERIKEAITSRNVKLLILDPLQAYLGNRIDMNSANEAREVTKKLSRLAEETKCAIVIIGHMNKKSGDKAVYRGLGSIDFFAVARSVLLVGKVREDKNKRAIVQIKNNLAPIGISKAFELVKDQFQWYGDYEITAEELLHGESKSSKVKKLIMELTESYDYISSKDLLDMVKERGISKRTLDTVKSELAIGAKKKNNVWYWDLRKLKK